MLKLLHFNIMQMRDERQYFCFFANLVCVYIYIYTHTHTHTRIVHVIYILSANDNICVCIIAVLIFILFSFCFGHAARHAGYPHQGSNPCPQPPAVEAWSPNHWTGRKLPSFHFLDKLLLICVLTFDISSSVTCLFVHFSVLYKL